MITDDLLVAYSYHLSNPLFSSQQVLRINLIGNEMELTVVDGDYIVSDTPEQLRQGHYYFEPGQTMCHGEFDCHI